MRLDKDKKTILWVSNSPLMVTGYAKVTRELCKRLTEKYNVVTISNTYTGTPINMDGYWLVQRNDQGMDTLQSYVNTLKPEYMVTLDDTFTQYREGLHQLQKGDTKLIAYVPIDGNGIPFTGGEYLKIVDYIVPMSHYGKEEIEKEGFTCDKPIWHGVDTTLHKPLTKEEKTTVRKNLGFTDNDFIILNVARNSHRKMNMILLQAQAKIAKRNPKVKFFNHISGMNSVDMNLPDYINRILPLKLGKEYKDLLNKQIFFSPFAQSLNTGADDRLMAQLYGMVDLHLSCTSGEGFGLFTVESEASGVPTVCTNYSTTKELVTDTPVGQCGLSIKSAYELYSSFGVEHAMADVDDTVKQVERMIKEKRLYEKCKKNSLNFAEKYLDWDVIINRWHELFERVGTETVVEPIEGIEIVKK